MLKSLPRFPEARPKCSPYPRVKGWKLWITTLTEAGVRISMDGRGRYLDNIFIERLWRSLKQEAIYLEEITDGFQARRVITDWMAFYNTNRPHSALDRQKPDDAYWAGLEEQKAA